MRTIPALNFFVIIFLLASCAQQIAPEGGLKDSDPPKVLVEAPPNYSTNFKGQDIYLTFDEFIQLRDLNEQLVVSPPLKYAPVTKLTKRTLMIHLDDTLMENTTYTMNFGNSIIDNHENLVLEDFQYVFSTGPVLDSLAINGTVENAFDKKHEKNILVMLYRNLSDSIPYNERPVYFAKTDENGKFNIRNISPDTYKLFALQDVDGNYLYERSEENMAFLDFNVSPPSDSLRLRIFRERPAFRLTRSYTEEPGKIQLVFSGAVDTLSLQWLTNPDSLKLYAQAYSKQKDTLTIWYLNLLSDSLNLIYQNEFKPDTISVRLLKNEFKGTLKKKSQLNTSPSVTNGSFQDLNMPVLIKFSHPIQSENISLLRLTEDTTVVARIPVKYVDSLHTVLELSPTWNEGTRYSLYIPQGAFTDIYGVKNDSVRVNFITRLQIDYGSVAVQFQGENISKKCILQLMNDNEIVIKEAFLNGDSLVQFTYLPPGLYKLKVIDDKNNNGRWDTGNYMQNEQPELINYYPEKITVRANWDVEIKWSINAPVKIKKLE